MAGAPAMIHYSEQSAAFCGIAVMAKASAPGRVKTRLVPPLSYAEAAELNTAFLRDTADNIVRASSQASIKGYMAFGPTGAEAFFRDCMPPSIGLIEAWLPNFGDCLFTAIEALFDRGHGAAVVLNSDSPTLPTELLSMTAEILAQPGDRAVLGPSEDGGYYLLGIKRRHRRLFEEIDWSTERVAHQTLSRAAELGLPVHRLPTWFDVDDVETLRKVRDGRARTGDGAADLERYPAPHTAALLKLISLPGDLHHSAALRAEPAFTGSI
jgi:rSAM/selenodomain-associated transferase 1